MSRNSPWKSLRSLQPPMTQNNSWGVSFLVIMQIFAVTAPKISLKMFWANCSHSFFAGGRGGRLGETKAWSQGLTQFVLAISGPQCLGSLIFSAPYMHESLLQVATQKTPSLIFNSFSFLHLGVMLARQLPT